MPKAKIFYILTLGFISCLFFASPSLVQASEEPVNIFADMAGLNFDTPLSLNLTQTNLFKSLEINPTFSIQVEPSIVPTLTLTQDEATKSAIITAQTTPTSTPTPTPKLTPKPTPTSTPTPTILLPTNTPPPTPSSTINYQLSNGGLDADKIFNLVNAHRQSIGLKAYEKDSRSCEVASSRAPQLAGEFKSGNYHQGLRSRNLPYWNHENIIAATSEEKAVQWWLSDYIHKVGIEGDYKFSCVACSFNNCVQEFTSFTPK